LSPKIYVSAGGRGVPKYFFGLDKTVVNDSAILAGGKAQSLLSQVMKVNIGNANMVNVDSMREVNPEQVLTSQVVGMVSVSKVFRDKDGYVANMVKRDMVDNTDYDSDVDSEHDEEMNELLSAQECGVSGNSNEVPVCVSQQGEKGDIHEKPEERDVMTNINPEGRYDEGKMVEKHKQPEKRDVVVDTNPKGKHNNEKTLEKPCYEKPEWRDMMIDINYEGKYSEEEVAEKQLVAPKDALRLGRAENISYGGRQF
jgi:hypothetical protein